MSSGGKAEFRPANQRGAARLAAVQALYQMDLAGATLPDVLAEFASFRLGKEIDGTQYRDADGAYFRDIVGGVVADQKIANKSKERAAVGREIAAQISHQQAEAAVAGNQPITLDMIEAAPGYAARAELIRSFVRQDPDRAALVVRDLIRADMPKAEAANA